jgi:hypothetical protein
MRVYVDTEFIEDGKTIELLSVGLVREDGAELYLENAWADLDAAGPWVREHVLPMLGSQGLPGDYRGAEFWVDPGAMQNQITAFAGAAPEFWGYYSAYDWVALCQLFGAMVLLPEGWPMYCHDLRQWLDTWGLADIKQPDTAPHHALLDARWIATTHTQFNGALVVPPEDEGGPRAHWIVGQPGGKLNTLVPR